MNIEELDLSCRSYVCLKRAGIDTVEQLRQMDNDKLRSIPHMNERCFQEITEKMENIP